MSTTSNPAKDPLRPAACKAREIIERAGILAQVCEATQIHELIADAIEAAGKAPKGCVVDEEGVARRYLGKRKLTDDGCVAGEQAECWAVYRHVRDTGGEWRVGRVIRDGACDDAGSTWVIEDGTSETGYEVGSVWSTKELAEADYAKREGGLFDESEPAKGGGT